MSASGGVCHVMLAMDVAMSIDLARAEALLDEAREELGAERATRPNISDRYRVPEFIAYSPAPLRIRQSCRGVEVGSWRTASSVEVTLFDFGAASVVYRIEMGARADSDGLLREAASLGEALRDHAGLREDARARVLGLCAAIGEAMQRPELGEPVEDYAVFVLSPGAGGASAALERDPGLVASVLRGEAGRLSEQEVREATGSRLSYTVADAIVVDWSTAIVVDDRPEDVLAVLEFCNVELLEMRLLDERLDRSLEAGYDSIVHRRWWKRLFMGQSREMRRLSAMQTDAALMFEGVNNAIKLVGDQYLARVYRATAARMGVPEWQSSVRRKLSTLESIFDRVAEAGSTVRMEILEWIIVLLILFEVVMSFV